MIVRLEGTLNGDPIIFKLDGSGLWTTSIPSNLTGEYIVSVTAYDEAGNVTTVSDMLFIISGARLSFKILPLTYATIEVDGVFLDSSLSSEYAYTVDSGLYIANVDGDQNRYRAEVV